MRERVSLALVHHPTVDREGKVVATAVTTIDLHDLARLARTYGLGRVYATTPHEEQRALVGRLLAHWLDGHGGKVNPWRREALAGVRVVASLEEALREETRRWGTRPRCIGTSAREGERRVSYPELRRGWPGPGRPWMVVFGTGWGLAPQAADACDWMLEPVRGAGEYNHLSVRSAASIVVDRLFGDR